MRARSSPVGSAVREFSKAVIAERGVTHGQINFIPVMMRPRRILITPRDILPTTITSPKKLNDLAIKTIVLLTGSLPGSFATSPRALRA